MKIPPKKLLKNVYFAALNHKNSAWLRMNDLLRDDLDRKYNKGLFDAYSYIVQMIDYHDTIGIVDYKKIFNMEEKFPEQPKINPYG